MSHEIETKFSLSDPQDFKSHLVAQADLTHVCDEFEENTILDDADRSLLTRGCGLRIRRAFDQNDPERVTTTLTFKGPRDSDPALAAAAVRAREELETTVAEARSLLLVFERLGFGPVIYYEKRRATWQADDVEIVLDELPELGWFAEIEASSAAVIDLWRARLEIPPAAAESRSYVRLTAEQGHLDSKGVHRLAF